MPSLSNRNTQRIDSEAAKVKHYFEKNQKNGQAKGRFLCLVAQSKKTVP
jgi:hypothetical protein